MVVHSQPVCPPHTPSPFQFARFGMSASTKLLSFYSSMKKLCVSIICVVTYNWGGGGGKEREAGGSGSIQLSWWWM